MNRCADCQWKVVSKLNNMFHHLPVACLSAQNDNLRACLIFSIYYAMMPNPKEKAEKLKLILHPNLRLFNPHSGQFCKKNNRQHNFYCKKYHFIMFYPKYKCQIPFEVFMFCECCIMMLKSNFVYQLEIQCVCKMINYFLYT